MTKVYIEHDSGYIDAAAVVQVNYSTAQGGTVAVSTQQSADGAYGQVVARLEPLNDAAAAPAALLNEDETRMLNNKLRATAASLTLAMSKAAAAFEKEGGHVVYLVSFDLHSIWVIERAADMPGVDYTLA